MSGSRRACLLSGPLTLAAALVACSSPATRYYRLIAIPGTIQHSTPMTLAVRGLSIPGYLNRDEIAKAASDYRFAFYSNDLWADQLSRMLQIVMVQDLAQRLPEVTVFGSGGAINASSDVLVEINVLRFDPDSRGGVVLDAQIAVKSGPTRKLWMTQSFNSSGTLSDGGADSNGPDASQIVSTMSELWADMANRVADIIIEYQATRPFAHSAPG
jgi:uncharacterized protein